MDDLKKYEPLWDNWYIKELLGEGGFGKVYRIERNEYGVKYESALKHIRIPQSKAEIKSIMIDGMDETSITSYFEGFIGEIIKEFALMSKLRGNSHIVSYEDHIVKKADNELQWDIFIRMELLTSFLDYVTDTKITNRDIIKLGIDICKALETCQKYNIIHRDIKPENIFVSNDGKFKLGDFGIARQIEKTAAGLSKKGTYTYIAPEVYKGEPYGSSVDIYSLGLVMYRFLNHNRMPFMPPYPQPITYRDQEMALVQRLTGKELPMPVGGGSRLGEIVLKACSYDPKDRYTSPIDMRNDLESILYDKSESEHIYPKGDKVEINSGGDIHENIDHIGKAPKEDFKTVELTLDNSMNKASDGGNRDTEMMTTRNMPPAVDPDATETMTLPKETPFSTFTEDKATQPDESDRPADGDSVIPTLNQDKPSPSYSPSAGMKSNMDTGEFKAGMERMEKDKLKKMLMGATAGVAVALVAILIVVGTGKEAENDSIGVEQAVTTFQEENKTESLITDNIEYKVENGVLTIGGTGEMRDYDYDSNLAPWSDETVTKVVIEPGVKSIGSYAFLEMTDISSVEIGDGVESIGEGAFYNCTGLVSVLMPDTLVTIGDSAFSSCHNLTNISIPDSVTHIGSWGFTGCYKVAEVVTGKNVSVIKNGTFSACPSLIDVVIPDNIVEIESSAFGVQVKTIKIPETVLTIDVKAFSYCSELVTVYCKAGSAADNSYLYPAGVEIVYY